MAFAGKMLSWGIRKAIPELASKNVTIGNYADRALRFLADHKEIHELLLKCISSKPCDSAIETLCRAVIKDGGLGEGGSDNLFETVKDIRNFAEGTKINVVNELYEFSDRGKLRWVMERLNLLEPERKAKFLWKVRCHLPLNCSRWIVKSNGWSGLSLAIP